MEDGFDASLFPSFTFCRYFISKLYLSRNRPVAGQRPIERDSRLFIDTQKEICKLGRHDLRHLPDAVDLYPILHLSAELYVFDLFCVWVVAGFDGVFVI